MQYGVYKSLDKKNSLFGIRGSYQKYTLYGLGVSVMTGLIVGTSVNSLLGTILAIILGVATYAGVLAVQAKYSEKERTKWFCSKKLPGYIFVPPKRFSKYVRYYITERYEVRGRAETRIGSVNLDDVLRKLDEAESRTKRKPKEREPVPDAVSGAPDRKENEGGDL
jgi:hypothetical protein